MLTITIFLFRNENDYIQCDWELVIITLKVQDGPPPRLWLACQEWWRHTCAKGVIIKGFLFVQWGFLGRAGWLPSTSKNGLREQEQESWLGFLWWSGGAGVRVSMHGLNFPWVPKEGVLGFLISFPGCGEEGAEGGWGLKAVSSQILFKNNNENGVRLFITELIRQALTNLLPNLFNF